MTDKKELHAEEIEKISGGGDEIIHLPGLPGDEIKINPLIKAALTQPEIEPVKVVEPAQPSQTESGGNKSYINTNNGGKQMLNQGDGNTNSNQGTMNW